MITRKIPMPLASCRLPSRSIWPFSCTPSPRSLFNIPRNRLSLSAVKRYSTLLAMDGAGDVSSSKEVPLGLDPAMEKDYASLSKSLLEFTSISSVDKAWIFKSDTGKGSKAMFSVSQPNLLENKKRRFLMSAYVEKEGNNSLSFQWSPFPVEMQGVSNIVPSPSGSKLLVVRNPENESPTKFEIWDQSGVEKVFHVPQSVHGSVYADGWFEGVSWNSDETFIAYIAEEPSPSKPTFNMFGYKTESAADKDFNSWKGQGDWEEGWGEAYVNKRRPTIFVISLDSGEVRAVKGISQSLSVGQVIWSPTTTDSRENLVFVGWPSGSRKLGIKYCYNRPCSLYMIHCPFEEREGDESAANIRGVNNEASSAVNLSEGISSASFPRFSPDGKYLVFFSAKTSVDSGAHRSTFSLHRIDWSSPLLAEPKIIDVVPVVMCPKDGSFPGLYCTSFLTNPWLSNGYKMILSSCWRSTQVILSVDILSGEILRITPPDSLCSWNILALDEDNLISVCSSPVDLPQIMYGSLVKESASDTSWSWKAANPISKCSPEVKSLLSSLQFSIMRIPVRDASDNFAEGAKNPIEAIFVSSKNKQNHSIDPLIVLLHGGPHSVWSTNFSRSSAFLSSIGFSLLIVNYRGSLGFGEEALQSLPGKVGTQDVNDVLTAIDHVVELKLASPQKIAVLGGSHGGFLATHLIGQAPERFAAAVARNPACNLELMVGTSDIPDWCLFEAYGNQNGKFNFTECPSIEQLNTLYKKSPISHINKVKTPTLFLIGEKDLRVPASNGLQFARGLKERGVEVKIIAFPEDNHPLDRPQSDFESFLNIAVWFKKYCK